ncbi:MAG TPA: DinB family protein [Vicinamibacterales bacterium]
MSRSSSLMVAAILTAGFATAAAAQTAAGANPYADAAKRQSDLVKGNIVKAAEKMPEEHYAFKPTPEVRSFGAILGHIANANYMICSRAAGTESPAKADIEKTVTAKADLVKALGESFAYCDEVLGKLDDKAGAELVKFFGGEQPKLMVIAFNTAHNFEHYGNLVTYMRMKGLVPPSSEGR